jgi:hypothetical protein
MKGKLYSVGTGEPERHNPKFRVMAIGEYRAPKKGEWFLSGAIVEGYRAFADMSVRYHIGQLVEVEEVKTLKILKYL